MEDNRHLIYDWNKKTGKKIRKDNPVELDDETLRDGLQSPSVTDPDISEKIQILHLMDDLGIQTANIGLPGAGTRAREDVITLAAEIVNSRLNITPNCAARTVKSDIEPIIEAAQKVGTPIEACTFIGSSPIRRYAEDWSLDMMLKNTEMAVKYAVDNGLPVMYVTEDTTRADPDTLKKLYTTAIECGARRICVCDTVGHAIPSGVKSLIKYIKNIVKATGEDVKIDWHGHRDRGLSIPNAIAAVESGADRIHATALGIGERVGNTPMDILLVNLKLLGWVENDLTKLSTYCQLVSKYCNVPILPNYPIIGEDAFRTGTGVHAAAVIKAEKKGDAWLADRVYSGVPAGMVGSYQKIEIGPMSGRSNIIYWLEKRGIDPHEELVTSIFDAAKESKKIMKEEEIYKIVNEFKNRED
ncbi:MAG: LeuA family protein [Fidelibacterota bacterium]